MNLSKFPLFLGTQSYWVKGHPHGLILMRPISKTLFPAKVTFIGIGDQDSHIFRRDTIQSITAGHSDQRITSLSTGHCRPGYVKANLMALLLSLGEFLTLRKPAPLPFSMFASYDPIFYTVQNILFQSGTLRNLKFFLLPHLQPTLRVKTLNLKPALESVSFLMLMSSFISFKN